jgi:3-oxoacyl-[acyl-carrier protein] reductase
MANNDLAGRVALVTGGSSGIGYAAAMALAGRGAAVAINYWRNTEGAEKGRRAIVESGGKAIAVKADVSTGEGARRLVETTRSDLGAIDILVNNAGDILERRSMQVFTEDLWQRVMDLNLKSVWLCSQAVMDEMIERRKGTIVNVGSIAGHHAGGPGAAVYAAAKAGVMCLTKGLAKELAPFGVRVNGVAPGVIMTPFHERVSTPEMLKQFAASVPLGRLGEPEEVGSVIAFLASDDASYINGEMIEINGGQLMV